MIRLGHADSDMVRYRYHLDDEEPQREIHRLDLRGEAGKQRPGLQVATKEQEFPPRECDATIPS